MVLRKSSHSSTLGGFEHFTFLEQGINRIGQLIFIAMPGDVMIDEALYVVVQPFTVL